MLKNFDLFGREQIIEALLNALARKRISHAYLFCGSEGSGKKSLANFWARALNCQGDSPPCQECPSCRKAIRQSHPDVLHLEPRGASIKIEQLREIKDSLFLAPYEGKYRIIILEEAHELTLPAANSLLKILEEPPQRLVFIILTSKPWALLPTVVSRCLVFHLPPLPSSVLLDILQEKLSISREKAAAAVSLAGGIPGRALQLANLSEEEKGLTEPAFLLEMLEGQEEDKFLFYCEELARRKDLDLLLESLSVLYRDRLVWQATGRRDLLLSPPHPFLEIPANYRVTENKWRIIEDTRQKIKDNVNPRLALEAMFWRMRGVV